MIQMNTESNSYLMKSHDLSKHKNETKQKPIESCAESRKGVKFPNNLQDYIQPC